MENKRENISTKELLLRSTIAFIIIATCIVFVLYLFDVIEISFIDSMKFKVPVTIISLVMVVIYYIVKYGIKIKELPNWKEFIFLSFFFELIGYWWIEAFIGRILIIVGFGLLILGFVSMYKKNI